MAKVDRKKLSVKKVPSNLTAADLLPDERGAPVLFEWTAEDLGRIKNMARIGMTSAHIASILDMSLSLFDQRIALHKKKFEAGDKDVDNNLFCILEKARAEGGGKLIRTMYEVATDAKNPTMLIWLSKMRLGWRESVDISAEHKHTLVYETQIAEGVLRQEQKQVEAPTDITVIDAMIEEITEEACPKPASE